MKKRAFTLLEIITVMFLLLIMIAMIAQMAIPSILMFKSQLAGSEARQTALVIIARLQRALENSDLASVTLNKTPPQLSLVRVVDFDPGSGQPKMDNHFEVYCYDAGDKAVLFRTWKTGDTPALTGAYDFLKPLPPHLSLADLGTLCTEPGTTTVGRQVESFSITDQAQLSQAALVPPLNIQVECLVESSGASQSRPQRFALSCQISPGSTHW